MILTGEETIMVARMESVHFFRLYYKFFGNTVQNSYIEAATLLQHEVGKVQKQPVHRSTMRHRTPYERRTPSKTSGVETVDDTTNSSSASSLVEYACRSSVVEDCDDNARGATTPEIVFQRDFLPHRLPAMEGGPRIRRSPSVSSSGCSSSMDDRNCDFSPYGEGNSCRCSSLNMSDFDDDGFREDATVSSLYSVFSGNSRSYQALQQNHQQHPQRNPANTKGLFDIALKTVKLIRRNQELQKRLAQLQQETKAFVESVMANPENESLRSHYQTSAKVSSSVIVQK